MSTGWTLLLNGSALVGDEPPSGISDAMIKGCLTSPPDGMGVPGVRVEDVTYPQRDGVRQFDDWYLPRIVTASNVMVCPDTDCVTCSTARAKARDLSLSWSRHCAQTELVIFTDCHDPDSAVTGADRALIGPYGVIGKPRVAQLRWVPGDSGCGVGLYRFDAIDHRLYVLDAAGTPGSGEQCALLGTATNSLCRDYDRCYDTCTTSVSGITGFTYSNTVTGGSGDNTWTLDNFGDLCAQPSIVLTGSLTNPVIENLTTGQTLTYTTTIIEGNTVTIDTETGTAVDQDGNVVTEFLTGDARLLLDVGENLLRLTSTGATDTGSAVVCFRPAVLTG